MTSAKTDKPISRKEILRFGALAAAILLSLAELPAQEKTIAIKAGRVQTVSQGEVENGVILVRDSRIAEIGAQLAIPAGAEVWDFSGKFVMPGIVSPDSNLGVYVRPERATESFYLPSEPQGKNLAYYPVLFSIYPESPDYALALKNGFTTLAISPPPAGISGLGAVIRPEGETLKEMLVKDRAFLKINVYVHTPFWNMLKEALEGAQKTIDDQKKKAEEKAKEAKEKKKEKVKAKAEEQEEEPTTSETAKVFIEVVEGKMPLLAECEGPDAVLHLAELLAGFPKVKWSVRGGPSVFKAGQLLKEKDIPVILEPAFGVKVGFLTPYAERTNTVLKCQALGLKIALQAAGSIEEQIHLLDSLNLLRQCGVTKEVLFKGVTLVPAQIMGLDGQVGSLEKGRRADFIVLKGDPLESVPVIEKVILGGRAVQ
jgi:imidazolonepropionase-like amidohydrolase